MKRGVLLIGGPSSVGKSTAAAGIARRLDMPWLQVDDLRLAIQENLAVRESGMATSILAFFEETRDVWSLPQEQLVRAFVATAEALEPSLRKVIANHLATGVPIVIEGDGFLPSMLDTEGLRVPVERGEIRAIFLIPDDAAVIEANLNARGWGVPHVSAGELASMVRAKMAFGELVRREAMQRGFPILSPLPYSTLTDRMMELSGMEDT